MQKLRTGLLIVIFILGFSNSARDKMEPSKPKNPIESIEALQFDKSESKFGSYSFLVDRKNLIYMTLSKGGEYIDLNYRENVPIKFLLFDTQKGKYSFLKIDFKKIMKFFPEEFANRKNLFYLSLIRYVPGDDTIVLSVQQSYQDVAFKKESYFLFRWNLTEEKPFGSRIKFEYPEKNIYTPIGLDPEATEFYFFNIATQKIRFFSMDLKNWKLKSDFEFDREAGKRAEAMNIYHFSSLDSKYFFFAEYEEIVNVPVKGYIVDLERNLVKTIPIQRTCYGAAFSSDNQYLYMGSNQTGIIQKYEMKSQKVIQTAKSHPGIHKILYQPKGELFVFASNASRHPGLEVFSAATLKKKYETNIVAWIETYEKDFFHPESVIFNQDFSEMYYEYTPQENKIRTKTGGLTVKEDNLLHVLKFKFQTE
ncbi:YncE family protein [Leptospira sp. WS92.C1]